jgi:hypothetical protein
MISINQVDILKLSIMMMMILINTFLRHQILIKATHTELTHEDEEK